MSNIQPTSCTLPISSIFKRMMVANKQGYSYDCLSVVKQGNLMIACVVKQGYLMIHCLKCCQTKILDDCLSIVQGCLDNHTSIPNYQGRGVKKDSHKNKSKRHEHGG